jgi:hypothetical protein
MPNMACTHEKQSAHNDALTTLTCITWTKWRKTHLNMHAAHTQYNIMKQDLKLFGHSSVDAILKEVQQLHDWKVIEPIDPSKLSCNNKKSALSYLMFVKD